ncbi:hypothetical protein CspeluHIS016_0600470 [Cutaneotrichosporon spelunceum]|uniref:Ricin B lectin domain-containing protein n=1 Tax=Cutaneotrichosporon spelunceum TaxID=1672016 RepID=A0AAD3TX97_9TREE|nr:hypothetical protein CspeluHIS016_0600470 [Cutaneotrichosporon spelunceum]
MLLLATLVLLGPVLATSIKWAGASSVCLESFRLGDKDTMVVEGCGTGPEQQFELSRGPTRVKMAGKDLCLDAGDAPVDGQLLAFQACERRRPAQRWWFTDDGRIALEGQGLCVDLPNGNGENLTGVQVWTCSDGNGNQEWTV